MHRSYVRFICLIIGFSRFVDISESKQLSNLILRFDLNIICCVQQYISK